MNDVPLIVHIVGLELIVPSYGRCQNNCLLTISSYTWSQCYQESSEFH